MAETMKTLWDKAQETVDSYSARDAELDRMNDYYFLEGSKEDAPAPSEEGIETVVNPHATNVVDLVQDVMAGGDMRLTVPARNETPKAKKYADAAEGFLRACLTQSERIQRQSVLGRAAWLVAMRGCLAGRVMPVVSWAKQGMEDGRPQWGVGKRIPLVLQLRDPRVVYPQFGVDGLAYVVERWDRTVQDVRNTYGEDVLAGRDVDEDVEWTEYWDHVQYCCWANGKTLAIEKKSGIQRHGYGGNPYAFEFGRQTGRLEPEYRSRALLSGLLGTIDKLDTLDSAELTFAMAYIGSAWAIHTAAGKKFDLDLTPNAKNYMKLDEVVEPIQGGRTPLELAHLRETFGQMFERGTFPGTLFGEDPGRVVAGYAINLLNQSGQLRLAPMVDCVERFIGSMLENALMVAENFVAPLVSGPIPFFISAEKESAEGERFQAMDEQKFDARKLNGYYNVEVAIGDLLPGDQEASVGMAIQAQAPGADGRPLLSWETVVERFDLVRSAADERARIDRELAWNHPQIIALREALYVAQIKRELEDELAKMDIDADEVLGVVAGEQAAMTEGTAQQEMGIPPMMAEAGPAPAGGPMMEESLGGPPIGPEGMGQMEVPPEVLAQLPPEIQEAYANGEITAQQIAEMIMASEQEGGQAVEAMRGPGGPLRPGGPMGGGPPGPPPPPPGMVG